MSSFLIYNFKKNKNFIELWTRSRVLAETIKSEWFMFVVGGGDYPIKSNNEEVYNINKFLSKMEVLVDEYKSNIHEFEKKYSTVFPAIVNKQLKNSFFSLFRKAAYILFFL